MDKERVDDHTIRSNFELAVDTYPKETTLRKKAKYAIVPSQLVALLGSVDRNVEILSQEKARERFTRKNITLNASLTLPLVLYRKNLLGRLTGEASYELDIPSGEFAQTVYM